MGQRGEGDDNVYDGWMASPTEYITKRGVWVWLLPLKAKKQARLVERKVILFQMPALGEEWWTSVQKADSSLPDKQG